MWIVRPKGQRNTRQARLGWPTVPVHLRLRKCLAWDSCFKTGMVLDKPGRVDPPTPWWPGRQQLWPSRPSPQEPPLWGHMPCTSPWHPLRASQDYPFPGQFWEINSGLTLGIQAIFSSSACHFLNNFPQWNSFNFCFKMICDERENRILVWTEIVAYSNS